MARAGALDLRRRRDFAASGLQFRVLERARTPAELPRRSVERGGRAIAFRALYQMEFAGAGLGAVPRPVLSPRIPAVRRAFRRLSEKGARGGPVRRTALARGLWRGSRAMRDTGSGFGSRCLCAAR